MMFSGGYVPPGAPAGAPSCVLSACAAGYSATAVGGEATVSCDSASGVAVLTLAQGAVALGCVEVEPFVCEEEASP